MIRRATRKDFIGALFVYRSCIPLMNSRGLFNWNYAYPSAEIILEDISRNELFLFSENRVCLGAVCLNEEQPDEYNSVKWKFPGPFLVVHRLAVHPAFWNKKIGEKIMNFAEQYALENEYPIIRLDAITANPAAVRLYKKLGYEDAGEIHFSYQRDTFMCMEKELRNSGA